MMEELTLRDVTNWVYLDYKAKPHKQNLVDTEIGRITILDGVSDATKLHITMTMLAQYFITEAKDRALTELYEGEDGLKLSCEDWVRENLVDTPTWGKALREIVEVLNAKTTT